MPPRATPRAKKNTSFPSYPPDDVLARRVYHVLHNGGLPFRVVLDPREIAVYALKPENSVDHQPDRESYAADPMVRTGYRRVFVGRARRDPRDVPGHPVSYKGNSVLAELPGKQRRYMFAGHEVFEFDAPERITGFYSPVGNSGVPYPYALGRKYVHLLLDRVALPRSFFADVADPYEIDPTDPRAKTRPFANVEVLARS